MNPLLSSTMEYETYLKNKTLQSSKLVLQSRPILSHKKNVSSSPSPSSIGVRSSASVISNERCGAKSSSSSTSSSSSSSSSPSPTFGFQHSWKKHLISHPQPLSHTGTSAVSHSPLVRGEEESRSERLPSKSSTSSSSSRASLTNFPSTPKTSPSSHVLSSFPSLHSSSFRRRKQLEEEEAAVEEKDSFSLSASLMKNVLEAWRAEASRQASVSVSVCVCVDARLAIHALRRHLRRWRNVFFHAHLTRVGLNIYIHKCFTAPLPLVCWALFLSFLLSFVLVLCIRLFVFLDGIVRDCVYVVCVGIDFLV